MFVNSGKTNLQFCRIVIAQNPRYQHVAVFLSLLLQSAYDEVTLNNLEVSFVTHTKRYIVCLIHQEFAAL